MDTWGKSTCLISLKTHTSICTAWRSAVTTLGGDIKHPGILAQDLGKVIFFFFHHHLFFSIYLHFGVSAFKKAMCFVNAGKYVQLKNCNNLLHSCELNVLYVERRAEMFKLWFFFGMSHCCAMKFHWIILCMLCLLQGCTQARFSSKLKRESIFMYGYEESTQYMSIWDTKAEVLC